MNNHLLVYQLFFRDKMVSRAKKQPVRWQLSHLSVLLRQPWAAQYHAEVPYASLTCVTQDTKKLGHQRLRFNNINKMCSFIKTILMWGWLSLHYHKRTGVVSMVMVTAVWNVLFVSGV